MKTGTSAHRFIPVPFQLTALSIFTDRWNSTSQDEFSRKWNKPVHTFLLKHIHTAMIMGYRISKSTAMTITFLIRALARELVIAVVTRKFTIYLFTLQVYLFVVLQSLLCGSDLSFHYSSPKYRQSCSGNHLLSKRNKLMGNVVFWLIRWLPTSVCGVYRVLI